MVPHAQQPQEVKVGGNTGGGGPPAEEVRWCMAARARANSRAMRGMVVRLTLRPGLSVASKGSSIPEPVRQASL